MGDDVTVVDPFDQWRNNGSHLCFAENVTGDLQCAELDPCHTKGIILPLFLEVTWPRELRAVIYFVGLIYSFLGVSIVADIFMCAIEKITSKTKKIHVAASQDRSDDK